MKISNSYVRRRRIRGLGSARRLYRQRRVSDSAGNPPAPPAHATMGANHKVSPAETLIVPRNVKPNLSTESQNEKLMKPNCCALTKDALRHRRVRWLELHRRRVRVRLHTRALRSVKSRPRRKASSKSKAPALTPAATCTSRIPKCRRSTSTTTRVRSSRHCPIRVSSRPVVPMTRPAATSPFRTSSRSAAAPAASRSTTAACCRTRTPRRT